MNYNMTETTEEEDKLSRIKKMYKDVIRKDVR